ncbi:MAG: hypothetical protein L0G49_11750 [Luteococcus sp.]|nr:hypothetical protein [Luteococcus sp.]MDN5564423.1 hypothetical protein [Luteococcus sp.]
MLLLRRGDLSVEGDGLGRGAGVDLVGMDHLLGRRRQRVEEAGDGGDQQEGADEDAGMEVEAS